MEEPLAKWGYFFKKNCVCVGLSILPFSDVQRQSAKKESLSFQNAFDLVQEVARLPRGHGVCICCASWNHKQHAAPELSNYSVSDWDVLENTHWISKTLTTKKKKKLNLHIS